MVDEVYLPDACTLLDLVEPEQERIHCAVVVLVAFEDSTKGVDDPYIGASRSEVLDGPIHPRGGHKRGCVALHRYQRECVSPFDPDLGELISGVRLLEFTIPIRDTSTDVDLANA